MAARARRASNAARAAWRSVLDREIARWTAMPLEQLVTRLRQAAVYEVEFQQQKYQVEVEILRDTAKRLEIMIAVDDGVLPRALHPLTQIVAREKFPSR